MTQISLKSKNVFELLNLRKDGHRLFLVTKKGESDVIMYHFTNSEKTIDDVAAIYIKAGNLIEFIDGMDVNLSEVKYGFFVY